MKVIIEGSYGITKTTITIETCTLYTSRIINSRQHKLEINVDGTIKDLLEKCDRVSKLSDELYSEFDRIRKASSISI